MNILFYRYGSICEPDILLAFQKLNISTVECTIEIEHKNLSAGQRLQALSEILCTRAVDFIFSINYFPVLSQICQKLHLLYVCWSVDCPVLELFSSTIRNSCNRIFLFDYIQYQTIQAQNPEHIYYLPLATNVERWDKIIEDLPAEDRKKYGCDISFVGSLYHEKSPLSLLNMTSPLPDYWTGYTNGVCEAQLKIYGASLLEDSITPDFIHSLKQSFPDFYQMPDAFTNIDKYIAANYYLGMRTSEMERIRALNMLATDHKVTLYTRSNTSLLQNVECRDGVSTHMEMPKIFHSSKINLNITMKSIQSGLSLRIWDILGCQGFLLTNYQSEIPEYFEIGKDLECYESFADLKSKVDYYLLHDDIRQEIAHNGYSKVKTLHTYEIRIATMLKTLLQSGL